MVGYAEDDNIINQKSHFKSNLDSLTREFDELVRETFESNVKYGILEAITDNCIAWNHLLQHSEFLIKHGAVASPVQALPALVARTLSSNGL